VHGLRYGIDSDGTGPHGVTARDGHRSDEILPGQSWTYSFDIDETTIGAWPFHDHVRHVQASLDRHPDREGGFALATLAGRGAEEIPMRSPSPVLVMCGSRRCV
jgi:hypothetical protein